MMHKPAMSAPLFGFAAVLGVTLLAACASAPGLGERALATPPTQAPEPRQAMVAAADPRAAAAAEAILRAGGGAVDAAIAAELVLGLVEPQSSGLGGGGFLMHFDNESNSIVAYDGRERAPMAATPELFLQRNGRPYGFEAFASGLAIGTPSLVAMLKLAHDEHGRLPWADLFQPAIALAEQGFEISPRLANYLTNERLAERLRADIAARSYFFDSSGAPWPAGHVLRNPTYARTLRAIAEQGPDALRRGPIADAVVRAAQAQPRAGSLALSDLESYEARRLEPICGPFRAYQVCGMPSPSSGGQAVLTLLGLYERARPEPAGAGNGDDWAAFLWASRLTYVDRDHYSADDEYAPVPQYEMFASDYLDQRAGLIDLAKAPQGLTPGAPAGEDLLQRWGRDQTDEQPGTTHLSIIDGDGDAVAMTASVQAPFGALRMAGGFMLNNELTDFAFTPTIDGLPVANAPGPGKRPRSSMAPTFVTDAEGELVLVVGSPGGSSIIAYVARTIIGVLDWGQDLQGAIDTGHMVARTPPARIEAARLPAGLVENLAARGWSVRETSQEASGLHAILVTPEGLVGGADPRREGVAISVAVE